jgi:site-specific recombinase XerD
MKERIADRIEKYMNQVRVKDIQRIIDQINAKRHVLEEFAFFMDGRKGRGRPWELTEITEEDGREYCRYLREKEKTSGVERKIQTVHSFLDFAVSKGWIERRPWETIF